MEHQKKLALESAERTLEVDFEEEFKDEDNQRRLREEGEGKRVSVCSKGSSKKSIEESRSGNNHHAGPDSTTASAECGNGRRRGSVEQPATIGRGLEKEDEEGHNDDMEGSKGECVRLRDGHVGCDSGVWVRED